MNSRDISTIFESFRKTSKEITTICRSSEVNINVEIFWTNVKYLCSKTLELQGMVGYGQASDSNRPGGTYRDFGDLPPTPLTFYRKK